MRTSEVFTGTTLHSQNANPMTAGFNWSAQASFGKEIHKILPDRPI